MSTTSRSRSALAALAVVLAGGLLSGCGVSDNRPRPGAAAQVEGVRISTDTVESTVDTTCDYFKSIGNQPFPRSLALEQFVSTLVTESALEQLMDETGASFDSNANYTSDRAALETQLDAIPDEYRDAVGTLSRANLVVSYGTYAVGDALFTSSGDVPGTAAEVTQRGKAALADWIKSHQVDINPIYQLAVVDGVVTVDGEGTSVARSDFAKGGVIDVLTTDAQAQAALSGKVSARTAQLPADQLCGG